MEMSRYLNVLISHAELFGSDGTLEDAQQLLQGLTSASILYKFAYVDLYLYLHEPGAESEQLQIKMLNSFLQFCTTDFNDRMRREFNKIKQENNWPVVFWEHSTLLFYDLIFKNYQPGPVQHLTNPQTENILRAYLIINSN